ncbi:MAG: HAD family hydrolase [Cyclobacteriaceae bacterium]|nr:HAD family hydrolase [Cyclobacteriaceae bacterium]
MKSFPQAVFFDFDGVILESADVKTEAFVELFKQYPHLQESVKQHHLQNQGVSRYKKFEWIYENLLHQPLSESESQELGKEFSNLAFDKVVQSPFVPGALELLQSIHQQCLCFVASGTPEQELKQIVERRSLTKYFKEVCGIPRSKTQIVLEMIEKYKLTPSKCWFVGDATTDFEAAKETQLNFIARNSQSLNLYWKQQDSISVVESLLEVNAIWTNGN